MKKAKKKGPRYDLARVLAVLEGKETEDLRTLYGEYSERMRHSGTQIWAIGSVFIPLSLSGVVLGLDDPYRTLTVAVFSVLLIWIWYFISVRIDTAFERDLAICAAIETAMLKLEPPLTRRGLNELVTVTRRRKEIRLRTIRFAIPVVISVGWLAATVASFVIFLARAGMLRIP